MAINPVSVTNEAIRCIGPAGDIPVTLVGFDANTGNATFNVQRNWSWLDNATYNVVTGEAGNGVTDIASNRVTPGQILSSFTCSIPEPTDTTAPLAALVSVTPTDITTPGAQSVSVIVAFTDA